MTITVDLAPEIEERFLAQARDRGLTLNAYVQEYLTRSAWKQFPPKLSPEDVNRMLDEAADLLPNGGPLSDFAMTRESIYTREDEW